MQPGDTENVTIGLKNTGQPVGDACWAFMHVKNPRCYDVTVTHTGEARPEPEIVSEDGGELAQVDIQGIGKMGDTCNLSKYIWVVVKYPWDPATQTGPTLYNGRLGGLICTNYALGRLDKCQPGKLLHLSFSFYDISEDCLAALFGVDYFFEGIDNDGDGNIDEDGRGCVDDEVGVDDDGDGLVDEDPALETGYFDATDPDVIQNKWDSWPTNALMKDKVLFDILFGLHD
jgi:hypothetical protein